MEDEQYAADKILLNEPIGPIIGIVLPYLDWEIPIIVMLTDDEDHYVEAFGQTKDGHVWALGGNDYIWTRSFGVSIHAGDGDDTIVWSYQPPALIDGGDGIDTLDLSGLPRGAVVNVEDGEADTHVPLFSPMRPVSVINVENVIGTDFDDEIIGDGADNTLTGGAGGDIINGGDGDDEIHSGSSGGATRDILIGGAGADRFVFNTADEALDQYYRDVVTDFEQGQDLLVFHSLVPAGSINFRLADYVSGGPEFLDTGESYLIIAHSSQPEAHQTTEVQLFLSDGFSHEYSAITLVGHIDLNASDFQFI